MSPGPVFIGGGITSLFDHAWVVGILILVVLSIAGVVLWKLIESAIAAGVDSAVPNLNELRNRAAEVNSSLRALELKLELDQRDDKLRSTVQTLCGTFIGLMGGFVAGWVAKGGDVFPDGRLGRAAMVAGIGLVLVFAPPLLITPTRLDRFSPPDTPSVSLGPPETPLGRFRARLESGSELGLTPTTRHSCHGMSQWR